MNPSHPGGASGVGVHRVEMVADFFAPRYPDIHIQTGIIRRFVYQVLGQCLEHHHGGLEPDREGKQK